MLDIDLTLCVYLDLETTGLDSTDEALEIAIIDNADNTLFYKRLKPVKIKRWPYAQEIHGISPNDVKDCLPLSAYSDRIKEIVKNKHVVIYNKAFDSQFFTDELKQALSIQCCMLKFSEFYGEWNDYYQDYKWQSLSTATSYIMHKWQGPAHCSLSDSLATKAVWTYLIDEKERNKIDSARIEKARIKKLVDKAIFDERREKLKIKKMREQLNTELTRKWLKRSDYDPRYPHYPSRNLSNEFYSQLFFNKSVAEIETEEYIKRYDLTVYQTKKAIPKDLKAMSHFTKIHGYWLKFANAVPDGVLNTKKSFYYLFSEQGIINSLSKNDVLRLNLPIKLKNGEQLYNATELKKHGMTKEQINKLNPCKLSSNPYSGKTYKIYKVDINKLNKH